MFLSHTGLTWVSVSGGFMRLTMIPKMVVTGAQDVGVISGRERSTWWAGPHQGDIIDIAINVGPLAN